jgi:hypothetical protein
VVQNNFSQILQVFAVLLELENVHLRENGAQEIERIFQQFFQVTEFLALCKRVYLLIIRAQNELRVFREIFIKILAIFFVKKNIEDLNSFFAQNMVKIP